MRARRTLFDSSDMERGCRELDLIPAKIRQLRSAEAMAISDEDHSAVAMTMAIGFRDSDQRLHFVVG